MSLLADIFVELIKAALSAGLLCLTWFGGQKILNRWDAKKKQRELDILTSNQLQIIIGEWKSIWRTWKPLCNLGVSAEITTEPRFTLFKQACAAEGKLEAIILRMVMDRVLNTTELEEIGLFRQAFQQLRENIRDNGDIKWTRSDSEYWLFHKLALRATHVIEREEEAITDFSLTDKQLQLEKILRVRTSDWRQAVENHSCMNIQ